MYIIYLVIILAVMAVDYLSYSVDKRDHDLDPKLIEVKEYSGFSQAGTMTIAREVPTQETLSLKNFSALARHFILKI